jgi:hypothetical protein
MSSVKQMFEEGILVWEKKRIDYEKQLDTLLLRQQNGDPNVTDQAVDNMLGNIHHAAEQVRLKREHLERLPTPSE